VHRRQYLATAVATLSAAVTGCGSDADDPTGSNSPQPASTSVPAGRTTAHTSSVPAGGTTAHTPSVPDWVRDSDADYHVDPDNGDNANANSPVGGPLADLRPFESTVQLGSDDTVAVRGGVYRHDAELDLTETTGADGSPVVIEPYRNETPVLDFGPSDGSGLVLDRSQHVTIRGLEIGHADEHNVQIRGNGSDETAQNAVGVTIEDCEIHGHGAGGEFGHGVFTAFGAERTVVRRCEVYDGMSGGNSDGLHLSDGSRNTVVERTTCHHNSDDGVDFGAGAPHDPEHPGRLRRVVCYRNGSNRSGTAEGDGTGFKTGDCDRPAGGHRLVRCVAFDNEGRGFAGPCTDVPLSIYNCTAVENTLTNVHVTGNAAHEVVNCLAQGSETLDLRLSSETSVRHCNWDESLRGRFQATDGDGREVRFKGRDPQRGGFLHPRANSAAIDAGARIGLEYIGDAPDWGAFECPSNGSWETTR